MNKVILPKKKAITIFLVFALGYYISNLLRAITATISPNLIFEFNLSAGDLGLLGGGYFLGLVLRLFFLFFWYLLHLMINFY